MRQGRGAQFGSSQQPCKTAVIEGNIRPARWAEVSAAKEEVRSVPGRRDGSCKGPEDAEKTRSASWKEWGPKCLERGQSGPKS